MTYTYEELNIMKMTELVDIANNLGVKINKKGSKATAIEKILNAEPVEEPMPNDITDKIPLTPKRGQLIEYAGKAQNICAWAKELGISANTLYGRLYRLEWTIEKAFTTKKMVTK